MKSKFIKEEVEKVISESITINETLKRLGLNTSSGNYKIFRKKVEEWSLDISHFLSKSEYTKKMHEENKLFSRSVEDCFVNGNTVNRSTLRKKIIENNLFEYECFKCGNPGEWMGEKITLILDHINGVNNDNRIENLRFACPNCNSTLKTHCKGFKGLEIKEKKPKNVGDRSHTRKVKRPDIEELIIELKECNYSILSRKYGVSDTAIRKWVKNYGYNPKTLDKIYTQD